MMILQVGKGFSVYPAPTRFKWGRLNLIDVLRGGVRHMGSLPS